MRYFRAFYDVDEEMERAFQGLGPLHSQFDDKVFILPYRRNSHWASLGKICVALIAKDGLMSEREAQRYFDRAIRIWDIDLPDHASIESCTVQDCFPSARGFERYMACGFEEDEAMQWLNLTNTFKFITSTRRGLRERKIEKTLDEAQGMALADETHYTKSLRQELSRIFTPPKHPTVHQKESAAQQRKRKEQVKAAPPITYIIEGDVQSDVDEAANILLSAMRTPGYLESALVFSLDIDDMSDWRMSRDNPDRTMYINPQLIRAIEGNALVIRYGRNEQSTGYDVDAYQMFTRILDLIGGAECRTQVIFSVPEGKRDLVARLRKRYDKPIVFVAKDAKTSLSSTSFESNLTQMQVMAKAEKRSVDDSMDKLLMKRMEKDSAVALEDVYKEWALYQEARQNFPQYAEAIDEVIHFEPHDQGESASERLNNLIGIESVKDHIRNIILRVEMTQYLLEHGLPAEPFSMHMAFVGSPGTGKTEVARLYAEILKDKGILSEGRLVSISGSGSWNVQEIFEAAKGSVLFIDEAYGLLGRDNAVAEFIAQMENNRADTVVILAGYEGHMNALLDSNPGFRSRVQTVIKFPDYSSEELREIFAYMCDKQSLIMDEETERVVRDTFERGGRRTDQGNARFARKLFEDAVGAQRVRLAKRIKQYAEECSDGGDSSAVTAKSSPDDGGFSGVKGAISFEELRTLTVEDIEQAVNDLGVVRKKESTTGREELQTLIGLEGVKQMVSARLDFAKMQKIKRDAGIKAPFIPMHMAFKGNPGTGKTEVARLIGRILHEEGVLSVGDFYECGRQDLVSPLVGASAPKVESLFRKARGSVIFIDEAYSLIDRGSGGPGDEAINALIDQMEKLRDEVVVIFAGYTREIDELFSMNPGFRSRVKTHIEFPDYETDELIAVLHHMADKQNLTLASGIDEKVRTQIDAAKHKSEFGNARFVRNLLEDALVQQSVRLAEMLEAKPGPTEVAEGAGETSEGVSGEEATGEQDLLFEENELSTLLPEDFIWISQEADRSIGFTG